MEKDTKSFDVCVICALPEEARAFLDVVRQQGEGSLEERMSPRYHSSYRFAIIKNNKGELLTLHISWLPRYGPQEMMLHLSRVLEEWQPRIAIMTGICAGDSQQVQLGDLVIAERTFTYDNGKFSLDTHGRRVHLHDTLTYQPDANILQFLGLFDDWEPLVSDLECPLLSPSEQPKTTSHIKSMASGSAVRGDAPFKDLQAPVRGTVAIDMEGAAFGNVMSHHPLIRWLIVKGVCDYADRTKNDTYHDYAARASALYALSFIRAYVTEERLPRLYDPSSSSRAGPSAAWNIPHIRNYHFTGRDDLLYQLNEYFTSAGQQASTMTRRAVLTQPQAIKGLGGIGKTQIAVEYAYRSRDLDRYIYTFWVNAASEEAIITSFVTIAGLLPSLAMKDETDQRRLVEAAKHWLETCKQPWLLIFDNADDLPIIQHYLPKRGKGDILLTTRANAVGSLAISIEVEKMGLMEGVQLLLHRAYGLPMDYASDDKVNEAINIVIALDYFPLALDQAGAYIEETQCNLVDYLQMYQTHQKDLLEKRGLQITNYPDSVATTWSLSFQKIEEANPAAAELLRLCTFLAPDMIPEELIREGAAYWTSPLQQAANDLFIFNQMIAALLKYSLVKRLIETQALSIHRLVQSVQKDMMNPEIQHQWTERVIRAVNKVFPLNSKDTTAWPQCSRYLDQVQTCNTLAEQHMLTLCEAASLLNRAGAYLQASGLWSIAEPVFQHALMIREEVLGANHPDTAATLNDLGLLYWTRGRYTEVEGLFQRALVIREEVLGVNHPDTATTLHYLGLFYWRQNQYTKAEELFQRALMIRKLALEATNPDIASTMDELGLLYSSQGQYSKAEEMLQHTLAFKEQILGGAHYQVAATLHNLGRLRWKQGQYTEAKELLQRALKIREQVLGATHPETINTSFNLGLCYSSQGQYTEAEQLYQQALVVFQEAFVPNHPDVGYVLEAYAVLLMKKGYILQAAQIFISALKAVGITHLMNFTRQYIGMYIQHLFQNKK